MRQRKRESVCACKLEESVWQHELEACVCVCVRARACVRVCVCGLEECVHHHDLEILAHITHTNA